MGIDINQLRVDKGGNPDKVKESVKKRYKDPKIVDEIIELDNVWRKARFNVDQANKELHIIQKEISSKKKEDKNADISEQIKKKDQQEEVIKQCKAKEGECQDILQKKLNEIGNIIEDDVPFDNNEDNNPVVRKWGEPKVMDMTEKPGACHHHQILYMLDGYDQKRGSKVAGHRGYFLRNYGVILNQALINYGIKFLMERGYTIMQPPYFMNRDSMGRTCQLSDFDEQLYKVSGYSTLDQQTQEKKVEEVKQEPKPDKKPTEEQKKQTSPEKKKQGESQASLDSEFYLIATSEQPISAYFQGEWLEVNDPIKFAGYSTCFRKEAGAAGKETWGLFRIHQFEKIEQFVICRPEQSKEMHQKMTQTAEDFLKSLELPHRTICIVSGALNDAATKKYDIEGWFPGYNKYKELMSVSNCTDYQSRAMEIRLRLPSVKKGGQKEDDKVYVHMLNGTLCATERTLTCILENYQEEKGLRVPKVLIPYVGKDFIEYTQSIPKKTDME